MDYTYWSKHAIENSTDSVLSIIFESGEFNYQKASIYSEGILINTEYFGIAVDCKDWPVKMSESAIEISLNPKQKLTVVFKKVYPRINRNLFRAKIHNKLSFNTKKKDLFYSLKGKYFFRILFIGVLAFLCLFTIFQYVQHRDSSYLYYSGYIFIMALYFLERHEANPFMNIFFSHNAHLFNPNGGGEPSCYAQLSFIFYILFTIEFLDLKSNYTLLTKYFYALIAMILGCYIVHLGMLFFEAKPSTIFNYYYSYRAIWNIPLVISLLWIAFQVRTKLAAFYLIGSVILTLTMIIPQFTYLLDQNLGGDFFSDNMAWMQVGILFECFLFSTGLGYKSKMIFEERDKIQQELLHKSAENIHIQQRYNTQLKEEVKIKSTKLSSQSEQLLRKEYEINLMNLEAKMLQAKMNPHFIYNCLNSIKYFVISKTSEETAQYITDFAGLMRSILENSRENFISLKEEIDFIKQYIQIEGRRFEEKFDFTLQIDDQVDLNNYIPPMLLQPIIENSIVHGLIPKDEKGQLDIYLSVHEDNIQIFITDNGIGRKAALLNKRTQNRYQNKTSLSSIITDSRLKNIKQRFDIDIIVKVLDNTSSTGDSTGTTVNITIPVLKDKSITKFNQLSQNLN